MRRRSLEDIIILLEGQGVNITPEIIAQLKQAMSQGEGELGISDAEVEAVGYASRANPRERFGNAPTRFNNVTTEAGTAVQGNPDRTNRSIGHDAIVQEQRQRQGTIPMKPVQRSSGGFNTARSGTGDTEIPRGLPVKDLRRYGETGGFNKLRSGTGDTEIPSGVPEESSYWDDFTSFFSSEDDGMLSDEEKKRKKKDRASRQSGGQDRNVNLSGKSPRARQAINRGVTRAGY